MGSTREAVRDRSRMRESRCGSVEQQRTLQYFAVALFTVVWQPMRAQILKMGDVGVCVGVDISGPILRLPSRGLSMGYRVVMAGETMDNFSTSAGDLVDYELTPTPPEAHSLWTSGAQRGFTLNNSAAPMAGRRRAGQSTEGHQPVVRPRAARSVKDDSRPRGCESP
jgi:hypothetical protein